jgi:hypothetical protein
METLSPNTEVRLAKLEAAEAIRQLKARYAAWADAKYTAEHTQASPQDLARAAKEQAACFTADAVWHAGEQFGGSRQGRAALEDWFNSAPWSYAIHFYGSPSITVHSATHATAEWRLWQFAIRASNADKVLLAGVTHEEYAIEDGQWKVASMRFLELQTVTLDPATTIQTSISRQHI